ELGVPAEHLLERDAVVVQLPGQLGTDVTNVPGLGAVAGDALVPRRVAEREAVLEGVVGQPDDRLRAGQAQIDRRSQLMLAVAGTRRSPLLLDRAKQARLFSVGS